MLDVRSRLLQKRNFDGLFSEDGIHPDLQRGRHEYILPQTREILA